MTSDLRWRPLTEALLGVPALTATEAAAAAGVDLDLARRLWRALGFSPPAEDERFFTDADVDTLRTARALGDRLAVAGPVLLQLARVTGLSLGRLADAHVAALTEPGDDESPVREKSPAELVAVAPEMERLHSHVWRRHLVTAFVRVAAVAGGTDRTLAVGFADLVGFTALTAALDARALAELVDRFEAIAYEQVLERRGWVVKMIGDEVMFAAPDAAAGAEIALALAAAHARDARLPAVRVGVAEGPTLAWEGDLVGQTVNLAHRLVNLARPGTVLVSDGLAGALVDDARFVLRRLRPVRLKGLGAVRACVLRPPRD
jgi:adenylate cyclase